MAHTMHQWLRETSLQAYEDLRGRGVLGEVQTRVAYLIATNPDSTDRELSKIYAETWGDTDPNAVRPRRHELMEQGWIEESGRRICNVSGHAAITWRMRAQRPQLELF